MKVGDYVNGYKITTIGNNGIYAEDEKTLNIRHINSVCNNDKYRHSAGGYIWRYANDRNS